MYEYLDVDGMQATHQSEETLRELYNLFYEELPEYQNNINELAASNNFQELHNLTHKLHGSCCYCYAPQLKALVAQVENESNSGVVDLESINLLNKTMDAVKKELTVT